MKGESRKGVVISTIAKHPAQEGMEQPIPGIPFEVSGGKDEAVFFFKRQNYKVSALVGRVASVVKTLVSLLDSSAGPNLTHSRCLAENWRRAIRSVDSPSLIGAPSRPMRPLGLLVLFVRGGQLRAHV